MAATRQRPKTSLYAHDFQLPLNPEQFAAQFRETSSARLDRKKAEQVRMELNFLPSNTISISFLKLSPQKRITATFFFPY